MYCPYCVPNAYHLETHFYCHTEDVYNEADSIITKYI